MDNIPSYLTSVKKILNDGSLDYTEKFEAITGKSVTETTARKRIYGIKNFINAMDELEPDAMNYVSEDIEDETNIELRKEGKQTSEKIISIPADSREGVEKVKEKLKDEQFLLEKHGYDPKEFKVVRAESSIYDMQQKGGRIVTLFSSKLKVERLEEEIKISELKDFINNLIENDGRDKIEKIDYEIKEFDNENYMIEISIVDLHLDRLGWHGEVGENYDIKIAAERFKYIIRSIIEKIDDLGVSVEKIIFPIGNDFFNVDNNKQSTNKGILQDTDVRWQKSYKYGIDLMIWALEKLSQIAEVEAFCVSGNHDLQTSFYLTENMYAYFHNNPNVIIDRGAERHKYIKYGNNLVGFLHGKEITKKNKRTIMQTEADTKWGQTKYRELHMAHYHSEKANEQGSIIFRNLSSAASPSSWEYGKGYIGAIKKSQTFVWNKKCGLEHIFHTIIPEKLIYKD